MDDTDDFENDYLADLNAFYEAEMDEWNEDDLPTLMNPQNRDFWEYFPDDADYDMDEMQGFGDYDVPEEIHEFQFSEDSNESESDNAYKENEFEEENFQENIDQGNDSKDVNSLKEAIDKMEEFAKYVQNLPTPEELKVQTEEEKGLQSIGLSQLEIVKLLTFMVHRRQELEKKEAEEEAKRAKEEFEAQQGQQGQQAPQSQQSQQEKEMKEHGEGQFDAPIPPDQGEEMQESSLLPSSKRFESCF